MKRLNVLPRDFGAGWMSNQARDLVKIAVGLAGFDAKEVATRLVMAKSTGARLNAATAGRVLQDIVDESKARERDAGRKGGAR